MIVCSSTECFPELPSEEIASLLVDLEFTSIELAIHEEGPTWVRPADVLADIERAYNACRDTRRLNVVALSVDHHVEGEHYYEEFSACCKLAKALKVVPLIVPAAELGTPFNAEIERLQKLVQIASLEGCSVALKTQIGCMTEDPDTAVVLCDHAKGLGLSLDPSHYIAGPRQGKDFSKVIPYVKHVHVRDATKSELHVRVGQGEVDFGRLVSQLASANYKHALCAHVPSVEGVDHRAELRKMRLLLESLL